jgi:hypothetical protein
LPATGHTVWRRWSLWAALLIAACCPDPKPADGGGENADGAAVVGGAKLSSIQKQVFDKSCVSDCHEGVSAAADLRLNAGKSFGSLVNVASQQLSAELRVIPTDADRSYLVRKLEGGPAIVGDQMPRLAPPLDQPVIDVVRSWIARGAPND